MPRNLLLLFLLSGSLASAQSPAPPPTTPPLTHADRQLVLDSLSAQLHDGYILPDIAKQMTASLAAHQQAGDYDSLSAGQEFAARLTAHLQAVSHDRHLRVNYSPAPLPHEQGGPSADEQLQYQAQLDRTNCGFTHTEIAPGNIGYLQINYFAAPGLCASTAAAAFKTVSQTDALIIDLRVNHGGDPRMVAIVASYLFDKPTHLESLFNRRENSTTEYWTDPTISLDLMPTQPVYILTSRNTFSGAEQLSYDLQNLNRAIVIGERTGGAAHPTRNHRIDDHFFVSLPEWRYTSPVTGTDWEGSGVTPDVPATPWNAAIVAQRLATLRLARPETPPAPPAKSCLDPLQ